MRTFTRSPIISLLFSSRPLAITGLVVAVVIYALYGKFGAGFGAHIGIEVGKGIPTLTYLYAATCIVFMGAAASSHFKPAVMFWRMAHAVFIRFSPYGGARAITTAGEAAPTFDVIKGNLFFAPTIAVKKVLNILAIFFGSYYSRRGCNGKFSKSGPDRDRYVFCHSRTITRFPDTGYGF